MATIILNIQIWKVVHMEDKKSLIKEKIELLNQAAKAYYHNAEEIMSNFEYDKL